MSQHRYSGWPGAWCLDCGNPDPNEEALAHDCADAICTVCHKEWPMDEDTCIQGVLPASHEVEFTTCGEHGSEECTEPGSRRFDPYFISLTEL